MLTKQISGSAIWQVAINFRIFIKLQRNWVAESLKIILNHIETVYEKITRPRNPWWQTFCSNFLVDAMSFLHHFIEILRYPFGWWFICSFHNRRQQHGAALTASVFGRCENLHVRLVRCCSRKSMVAGNRQTFSCLLLLLLRVFSCFFLTYCSSLRCFFLDLWLLSRFCLVKSDRFLFGSFFFYFWLLLFAFSIQSRKPFLPVFIDAFLAFDVDFKISPIPKPVHKILNAHFFVHRLCMQAYYVWFHSLRTHDVEDADRTWS